MTYIHIVLIFLTLNAFLISIFVGYHCFFIIWFFIFKLKEDKKKVTFKSKYHKFAIIVPAHNEEKIINYLIESAKNIDYPHSKYELIIVADNCNDDTEKIARNEGIKCFVRKDNLKKGKPYALEWIFKQIELDNFDSFTIIDADTAVDKNYLNALNRKLNDGSEVIQGYFGIMNPEETWLTKLMTIPGVLKFKIRYFCKDKMNLSCPLMGNGMCFSKEIIKKYGWNAFSITENWEYFVKLILNNYSVSFAENAIIYSHAVTKLSHGEIQRKRWFKGRLSILIDYYKILLSKLCRSRDIKVLDALIEIAMPSYSMLFLWSIILLLVVQCVTMVNIRLPFLLVLSFVLVTLQCLYFIVGLIISKASIKTWLMLVFVPSFLAWKLVVTIKGLLGIKEKNWQKTERKL